MPEAFTYRPLLALLILFSTLGSAAQEQVNDWDTYVTTLNGKTPVSVMVNLGLASKAPMHQRSYAIIIRTKLKAPDNLGQPMADETAELDSMENQLDRALYLHAGSLYVGRFTQRGLREFYFYALDTLDYIEPVAKVMLSHTGYQWLCQARPDREWTNYFQVLYPSPRDLEKLQNRRLVDLLRKKGDPLTEARPIDHYFYFKTKSTREGFLHDPQLTGFQIVEMPESAGTGEQPYLLHLKRKDVPDYRFIDKTLLPLWDLARKAGGKYDGWETYAL
jgi:uncharacterized protein (TIGR01619 family)